MKRSTIAVLVIACLGLGALVIAPLAWIVQNYGCRADDERLAVWLSKLSILDVHPPSAAPKGERGSACDDDDRMVNVWQSYHPSIPQADVLSFYQDFVRKEGWVPAPDNQDGEQSCFIKSVNGNEVYLSIAFPKLYGGESYDLNLSASLLGGGWC